jgi:hypothetical protein
VYNHTLTHTHAVDISRDAPNRARTPSSMLLMCDENDNDVLYSANSNASITEVGRVCSCGVCLECVCCVCVCVRVEYVWSVCVVCVCVRVEYV